MRDAEPQRPKHPATDPVHDPARPPEAQADERPAAGPDRILIVDDEPPLREVLAATLTAEGYDVSAVRSGPEALLRLRGFAADLVVSDMVMPGMDGLQFLAQVREHFPDTDVIIATGHATIELAVEAMRRGAVNFITKPIHPDELVRMTRDCLRAAAIRRGRRVLSRSVSVLELMRSVTRTLDLRVLPARAAELARANFDVESATILSYKPGTETFALLAHAGAPLPSWSSTEANELIVTANRCGKKGSVIFTANSATDTAAAYVALALEGLSKGVLVLRRHQGPPFHDSDREILELFASHVAVALESARLYHISTKRVSELEELQATSRTLSYCMDWEKICAQVLSGALRLTAAESSAMLVSLEEGQVLRTCPALPEDDPLTPIIRERMRAEMEQLGASGHAEWPSQGPAPPCASHRLASFISSPLTGRSGHTGLLAVFSSQPECFSVEDMRALAALANNASTAIQNAQALDLIQAMYRESIEALAEAVDAKDAYTRGHSFQVRRYVHALAGALHLGREATQELEDAAILHDLGKISVPDTLLKKPGRLTAAEFAEIKDHAARGAEMLRKATHLHRLVPAVRCHHERFDGSGYPEGLKAEEIPFEARVVAIADAFDAIVSRRVYREPMTVDAAREEILRCAGKQFDPDLARVFTGLPLEDLLPAAETTQAA